MELQPLYDSVTLLKSSEGRMVDVEVNPRSDGKTPQSADAMEKKEPPATSDTHISNLITTGPAVDAVRRIGRIKHRITDQTALCLMHEGLGVAEELNETVFNQGKDATPEYVLGDLDPRRLIQDRAPRRTPVDEIDFAPEAAGLIHVDPNLRTRLVPIDTASSKSHSESLFASALIDTLKTSRRLNAQVTPFHKWLHIKFQAMVFTAVVDPVSVVVGCRYDEIAKIKWGMSLMVMLLDEIQRVVAALPELHQSPLLRSMVERETLRKVCFAKLRSMKPTPSRMAATISQGRKVDIDSFNGYFIRRGKALGVECPYNEMVVAMIKARQGMRMKELDEMVPFEITSRPHRDLY
ncbi:uncharacterized protein DNG_02616 [Cephalotrichum gorgonifer]|uniref:Ketopantoate reductase C-terminal domain-containing protein n=1 Tax=Cephalotrichum gorgonifer TaxID=2041049 RepID=A0AAE8MV34_9PEZI|nr:uncharacterized protein DNG_02616 [Cephalotrichum gorgonifer]